MANTFPTVLVLSPPNDTFQDVNMQNDKLTQAEIEAVIGSGYVIEDYPGNSSLKVIHRSSGFNSLNKYASHLTNSIKKGPVIFCQATQIPDAEVGVGVEILMSTQVPNIQTDLYNLGVRDYYWGDGTNEVGNMVLSEAISHDYGSVAQRRINIKTDASANFKKIFANSLAINGLDLSEIVNVQQIFMAGGSIDVGVDLTTLLSSANIQILDISNNGLTEAQVDEVITHIYDNQDFFNAPAEVGLNGNASPSAPVVTMISELQAAGWIIHYTSE